MCLHGVLALFSRFEEVLGKSDPAAPGRKMMLCAGFIFPLKSDFVDLTNPHRGCDFHTLYERSRLIAPNRGGESLLSSTNSIGFHRPHFPPNQCVPRWGKHPISKRSQACGPPLTVAAWSRNSVNRQRRTSARFFWEVLGGRRMSSSLEGSTHWGLDYPPSERRQGRRISFILLDKNRLSSTMETFKR